MPPLYLELAITYRCDLDCGYCYQDQGRRTSYPDMTLEDVKVLASNLKNSFLIKPRIYVFGGEPTINPEFTEILEFLSEQGYKFFFATNGITFRKHAEKVMSLRGLENVIISLNPGNVSKIEGLIAEVDSCKKKNGPVISVNCPVDIVQETGVELFHLARRIEKTPAKYLTFQHSQSIFEDSRRGRAEDIISGIRKVRDTSYKIPVFFFPDIKEKCLQAYYLDPDFPGQKKKCLLPWFDIFIRPNGDVVPCDEVDHVVGNIKDESLRDIWNNGIYREFRKGIQQDGVSFPICRRCCHRQYC
ncbi:MAG: radical SAM protein [Candidatus Tantalella remota]|nr:radical SAM protein [Candidatus Tantalella remota]